MGWQPTSYSLLLALAAVMAAVLAVYARSRRGTPGAREVALLLLAVFVWCAAYAAESASTGLALKVFLAKVEYLGIASAPLAWFAFALAYTGRGRWLTGRNLALLAVIPAVTLLLVATNEAHGLVWSSTALESSFLVVEHGAWFWVFWIYSYSMLILGTYFLVSMLARSPGIYRRQGAALLVAVAAPWVGNGMYVLGLNPFPHLDLTPFAFLISGTAVSWGLSRFRFLEIVPVARDALVEVMEDGVIVVDPGGRVVDLNPAAQRVLDTTASEAVGEHLSRLSPVLDDLIDGYGAANGDLVAHKEVDLGGKEGAGRSYDLVLSSLRDRGSRRTGRLLVLRDVTERKHAEEEMIRQGVELARSNAELEHFAYLVAHDLRAPLRGINGFSQILLEDHANTLDDEGRDYLSRIRSGTLRMERLIDELLELSRLTRATMRRERVDLSEIARDVSSELRRGDPGREAEFVIADGLEANGDPHLLHVLLWNLLDNAWKFTQREPEARIELGAERRPEGPVFFVRDNGAGFEMAYADKLFKAFQRLHTSEEFEGTGIGLATVQRVVERHGGRVWAEGEAGRGATFYFTL